MGQDVATTAQARLERGYTRGPFGQLHYLMATPEVDSGEPPLVLLHQNPSSSLEYLHLIAELGRDRRVIAFDTPGNGMSDRPPEPQSMAGYAAAFADGLDAVGASTWGKADVFGFHTGTYLAVELALARPDLIGRVILSGVPFRTADERASRLEAALNPQPLTEDGESSLAAIRWMWDFMVIARTPGIPLERAVEMFVEKIKPMQRTSWPYVGVWSYDAEDRLPRLTQPVLMLQPHEALLEQSKAAAALIPNCTVIEFPHLSRDVFEVGVQDFSREIRAFTA